MDRYNVAVIAKLALKAHPQTQFIVSTTHLLYNPRREDVRVAQTQVLLAELDRLAYRQTTRGYPDRVDYLPIILTGDFNAQYSSEAYRLIRDGFVSLDQLMMNDRRILLPFQLGITDNCQHLEVVRTNQRQRTCLHNGERAQAGRLHKLPLLDYAKMLDSQMPFNTGRLTHGLNFTSAVPPWDAQGAPVASTYHRKWITVDYIFYTKFRRRTHRSAGPPQYSPLQLVAYLPLPTIDQCNANGGIPNANIGSDHYSLATQFILYHHRD